MLMNLLVWVDVVCLFFFFQAEDGIRDGHVTGVQTCALPIWLPWFSLSMIAFDAIFVSSRTYMALDAWARRTFGPRVKRLRERVGRRSETASQPEERVPEPAR